MAAWVMPSSAAALVKLSWRAAASKARMAASGGSFDMPVSIRPVDGLPLTITLSAGGVEHRFHPSASTMLGLAAKRGRSKDNGQGDGSGPDFHAFGKPAVGRPAPSRPHRGRCAPPHPALHRAVVGAHAEGCR